MKKSLKYLSYTVACQEVPKEVSLIVNISGCPRCCGGCHSQYLWNYEGRFIIDDLQKLIDRYPKMLTCVCFMGGDQNMDELNLLLQIARSNKLKTCVYTGRDSADVFDLSLLDYLKIGHYEAELGGLDKTTTNQRYYAIQFSSLIDITYLFQRGGLHNEN